MTTNKKTTRHFTEQEAREAVYEHPVDTIIGDSGRWSRLVTTIVSIDGRYYAIDWDEGLTENQENEFEEGDFEEVRKDVKVVARSEVSWVGVQTPDHDAQDRYNMRAYISVLSDETQAKLKASVDKAKTGDYSGLRGVDATNDMAAMLDVIDRYGELVGLLDGVLNE
jgi:hypothetical protein